jgi:hypothetical protein
MFRSLTVKASGSLTCVKKSRLNAASEPARWLFAPGDW